jgi:stress-induced morphogen
MGVYMFAADKIKEIVEAALPDCVALVHNDHNDGEHFSAEIVSSAFEGVMRVQQHRLVYKALGEHMRSDIHALALRTYTPSQWPH